MELKGKLRKRPWVLLVVVGLVSLSFFTKKVLSYEGFGATTPGGAGGEIVRVTNLNDSGPGSLREALSRGNRTVVFDVSGEILLSTAIRVRGAFITIDGFSAPTPGVTLRGAGLSLHGSKGAHDIIIQGIRIRDSSATASHDGITIAFGAYNIVVDHVSVDNSADGNIDITFDSHDVTVSWSILGGIRKNMLIKYNPSRVTLHHNIFTENSGRNPQVRMDDTGTPATDTTLDMRNNLIWDWGTGSATLVWLGPWANVVNNFYSSSNDAITVSSARAYVEGNLTGDGIDVNGNGTEPSPFPAPLVGTQGACTAANLVLAYAGARPLDSVDEGYLSRITIPGCHSIAVKKVMAPTLVTKGDQVTVNVDVQNLGTVNEVIDVTLTDDTDKVTVGSRQLDLVAGGAATVDFTWDTGNATAGDHTLTATAALVNAIDDDPADNSKSTAVIVNQPAVHDAAVKSVSAPASVVRGDSVAVGVDVANEGSLIETFNVSLTDTPPIEGTAGQIPDSPQTATLSAGVSSTLSFTWDTTNASTGTHTLAATASQVPGETDTADNFKTATVTVNEPVAGSTISVRNVKVRLKKRRGNWEGKATVTVVDETDNRVAEAIVSGDWDLNGSVFNSGASGTTGGQGRARVSSGKVPANSGDVFTFTVTHVSKTGATWDGQQKSASADVQDD